MFILIEIDTYNLAAKRDFYQVDILGGNVISGSWGSGEILRSDVL